MNFKINLMNPAHNHLLFNHLPIIIPIVGVLVMLGGIVIKSAVTQRTAYLIFILGALCTIPAFSTGEGAEEVLEHMEGISGQHIHNHEEIAETFAMLSYALGLISLIGLWASWKRKSFSMVICILTVLFSGIVLFFARQTGTSGGEIRHTEIRDGFKVVAHEDRD